jgi:hypothetical protein
VCKSPLLSLRRTILVNGAWVSCTDNWHWTGASLAERIRRPGRDYSKLNLTASDREFLKAICVRVED